MRDICRATSPLSPAEQVLPQEVAGVGFFPNLHVVIRLIQASKVKIITAKTHSGFAVQQILKVHPPHCECPKLKMDNIWF